MAEPLSHLPWMNRRTLLLGLGTLPLAGCREAEAKPRAIKWGRDLCEFCHMPIADKRFASQVWDAKLGRPRLYDEFGCAVLSTAERNVLDDETVQFWTADERAPDTWLDARKVLYRDKVATPMNYGHAAGVTDAYRIPFKTAAEAIREKAACEHKPV